MKELAKQLLEACDKYQEALDILFAQLIMATRNNAPPREPFLPTKSGQPWAAATFGNEVRERAREALSRPDAEAIAAAPELAGKLAVVVYFNNEAQRDAFVQAAKDSMSRMRTVKI
ncbi:MAG TPA: hypothetical protein VGG49_13220 [Steroidobacteraceae bacterium]|jgi:hypothetical protein